MGWTVIPDLLATESSSWTLVNDEMDLQREGRLWQAKPAALNPNAASAQTVLSFGGWAVEDLKILVEDLDLAPEDIQDDFNDWSIQAEPD